jgi:hypothetical protein
MPTAEQVRDEVSDLKQRLQDAYARDYINAMKAGKKLEERPEVGEFWEEVVEELERKYTKFNGNAQSMANILDDMCRQHPALADLLNIQPPPAKVEVWVPELLEMSRLDVRLGANACPELDMYIEFSREASSDAFDGYHAFCGMWLFSVIPGRRVYARIRRKRFYTNLMIALFGETSVFAKSFTAKVATDILNALYLRYLLAPNRVTPQKLLSDMAGTHVPEKFAELKPEQQERTRKRLSMPGQKGFIYDELGKFIRAMLRKNSTSADFIDIFLEFDACPDEYEASTISRGGEPIEKPYLALLGNITPPDLKDNARAGADFWTDGVWARFSFVVAPPATPDMISDVIEDDEDDDEELPIPQKLLEKLEAWHKRLGVPNCTIDELYDKNNAPNGKFTIYRDELPEHECTMDKEVKRAWRRYRIALRKMCLTFPHKDFHGSYNRLPETAMRMAVIMASLSNNNHITMCHWAKAQELAEVLRRYLHELYAQVNDGGIVDETPKATVEEEIIKHLERHGALTLNTLRHSYMRKWSVDEIEKGLKGLKRIGTVIEFSTSHSVKFKVVEQEEEN